MKSLLLSCSLWLCCALSFAQSSPHRVTGRVVDTATNSVIELVTVQLGHPQSKSPEYVQVSDLDGKFIFERVTPGDYELYISYVGYDAKAIAVQVDHDVDLGSVALHATSHALTEATVVADKPVITRSAEKTVFNVAQSPTHQTGTAEDALRNMPGVAVDRNGNISMIGKQGVKVLVDGKPSVLAESNLQAFLKSIPANTIESIELITNPSARYDAAGNAGIINIKLKKGKRDGLNGSVSATYGILNRYNGNAVLNYRKNKVNLFATYSVNYKKENHEFNDKRDITINDTLSHYYQHNPSTDRNLSNSLKAGLDYFINDKNTLTYTFSGSHNWGRMNSTSDSRNMDADFNPLSSFLSGTQNNGLSLSLTNDINYLKKYDSTDRELMIDLSHTYVKGSNRDYLQSKAYDTAGNEMPAQNLDRSMYTRNYIHNVIFKLDYVQPLKLKGYKVETGLKNETTLNHNDYNVYDKQNGNEIKNTLLSNGFEYIENIAAYYIIGSGAYKERLTYSAGLRAEHTYIGSNNSGVNRNYLSLFPSASLNGVLGKEKNQNLSLSYSRRVERPAFQQINNTVTYFDQYSTWQGNPYLRPAFSHILSLEYNITIKKTMLSISSENSFTDGLFTESSAVDSNRVTRGSVRNGSKSTTIGGGFYIKSDLTKWWGIQMNHYVAWQKFDYKAGINTGPVTGAWYNLWTSMDFKFWKNTIFNINGWFNSGDVSPQGRSKPCGAMNASIKKSFLKDRLTVSIVGQNILNTMKFGWYVNTANLHTNGTWQNYNRAVYITLTYRFGKDTKPIQRRDIEENSRLGGGGGKSK
ncbi:MAG: outer membrane beta-barrel protein [Bacteroidetes bacterium]|nr:outer membrane beta-barrel protein [Bacteroidota bacterium]